MAVAKAQAKGGVGGIHIWLIVFVALWLTSTVLLVLLYTDQKDLVSRNESLSTQLDDLRKQDRKLEADRAGTAEAATGEAADKPDVVQSKLDGFCEQIATDGLVSDAAAFQCVSYHATLDTLYEVFKSENQKLAQARSGLKELQGRVDELASANTVQKEAFDQRIAQVRGQFDKLRKEWEGYSHTRDEEVDGFEKKLTQLDERFSRDIKRQLSANKELQAKFEELQNRHAELQERLGELQIRPQELITARQADGRVVTAKPGEGVVYIDLGREDHLVLGLQFAVYSQAAGIPADGQSKARVEVVNIFNSTSECRIVETHGRIPILDGDMIANPIYDRHRTMRFLVLGRFDVDGDGNPDPKGDVQIESLIQNWGGNVTAELTARVDFVVLGEPPSKPYLMSEATPEAQARYQTAKKRYDAYADTFQTAQAMSIPILTESTFMHFLGFAQGPNAGALANR